MRVPFGMYLHFHNIFSSYLNTEVQLTGNTVKPPQSLSYFGKEYNSVSWTKKKGWWERGICALHLHMKIVLYAYNADSLKSTFQKWHYALYQPPPIETTPTVLWGWGLQYVFAHFEGCDFLVTFTAMYSNKSILGITLLYWLTALTSGNNLL